MPRRDYAKELTEKVQKMEGVTVVYARPTDETGKDWNKCKRSRHAANTVNPIRKIVDAMSVQPNPDKAPIKLHLGDPTLTGKLPPCEVVTQALLEAVSSHKFDGYGPSVGDLAARQAVVDKYSLEASPFTADDVILASGASHALQLAIEAIANPGDNILVPNPGFPLYSTLCCPHGVEDRKYNLDMNNGALIDLKHMESMITKRTKAIIINNPSNPTGAVFPRKHLEKILQIANKYRLTIIADEIYGDLTYGGAEFIPIASLSPKVPVITCDGIAKRWLVPGWRLGWCIVHDRYDVLADVKQGMIALSQKIVGPCALVQGALPKILRDTPDSFFEHVKSVLSENARIVYKNLRRVPGLKVVKPHGAMYMMVGIDEELYGEEKEFVQGLIQEQSIYCLPGSAFSAPGWFRIVLAYPAEVTLEACHRIEEFCYGQRHPGCVFPGPAAETVKEPKKTIVVSQPTVASVPASNEEDEGCCNSSDEGVGGSISSDEGEGRSISPDPETSKLTQAPSLESISSEIIDAST